MLLLVACVLAAVSASATKKPFRFGRPYNGMMNGPVIAHHEQRLLHDHVTLPADQWCDCMCHLFKELQEIVLKGQNDTFMNLECFYFILFW